MQEVVLLTATMLFVIRANTLRKLWSLPLKNGEGRFLTQPVGPGFYREAGAGLLRRYRVSLVVPLLLDIPLWAWLVVTRRYGFLLAEQFSMMLVAIVAYNVMIAHFSYRAQALAGGGQEQPATTVQLSMEPRRLRDHTSRTVELVILAAMLLALGLLAHKYAISVSADGNHADRLVRGGIVLTIWISYMQVGLLLLKVVFVRWRMPLPVRRTDEFRQWRTAWLSYHLKLFDSMRVLTALLLISGVCIKLVWNRWSRDAIIVACSIWIPGLVVYSLHLYRERRRLSAAERELKPIEMIKEFPRRAIPQGRFLAGGLLYVNRDNPVALVRSAQGIAINLAHPSPYVWAAYFIGLALLTTWILGSSP